MVIISINATVLNGSAWRGVEAPLFSLLLYHVWL